jgi:hypothetical protein
MSPAPLLPLAPVTRRNARRVPAALRRRNLALVQLAAGLAGIAAVAVAVTHL